MQSANQPALHHVEGFECGWVVQRNINFQWIYKQFPNNDRVTWAYGCDFPGHDIGHLRSSAGDCSAICLANPQCTHFFWGRSSNCFLKLAVDPQISPVFNGFYNTGYWYCGYVNSRV